MLSHLAAAILRAVANELDPPAKPAPAVTRDPASTTAITTAVKIPSTERPKPRTGFAPPSC